MKLSKSPIQFRNRIVLIGWMMALAFLFVGAGYYRVQILQQERYKALGEKYRIKTRRIKATRGLIYDRNEKLITQNMPTYNLVVLRDEMKEPWSAFAPKAAAFLGKDVAEFDAAHERVRGKFRSLPIVVEQDLELLEVFRVLRNQVNYPGLSIETVPRRHYEGGGLFAHVLGFVGEASPQAIKNDDDLQMGDIVGKSGIERYYNEILTGVDGKRTILVDKRGNFQSDRVTTPPRSGGELQLTLDTELQRLALQELGDKAGAVVMMDLKTGGLLTYVSAPSYNINRFSKRFTAKQWNELRDHETKPFLNRPIQGAYAPGSIFKLVVALSGLKNHTVNENTSYYCRGEMRYYDRIFHCHRRRGHGEVDLLLAIKGSCNIYFYHVAKELGATNIAEMAAQMGFGRPTDIDLHGEVAGLVPSPAWKRETQNKIWYPGETLSLALGQGDLLVTPVQLLQLMATIANNGRIPRPHLLAKWEKDGEAHAYQPEFSLFDNVTDNQYQVIKSAMWAVVNQSHGTGSRARVKGRDVCGKTGTAQLITFRDDEDREDANNTNAWFAGFAPRDEPEVAVVVLVERAAAGGRASAPIAGKLIEAYFEQKKSGDNI